MHFDCLPGYAIPDYPSSFFQLKNAALPVTWPQTSYQAVIALEKCMEDAANDTYIYFCWEWCIIFMTHFTRLILNTMQDLVGAGQCDGFSTITPFCLPTLQLLRLWGQQKQSKGTMFRHSFYCKKHKNMTGVWITVSFRSLSSQILRPSGR